MPSVGRGVGTEFLHTLLWSMENVAIPESNLALLSQMNYEPAISLLEVLSRVKYLQYSIGIYAGSLFQRCLWCQGVGVNLVVSGGA